MLPLISNVLPATPLPSQNNAANTALLTSTTGDASAASRQYLPTTAVAATPSAVAYFPGTPPKTTVDPTDRSLRVAVPPPTGDYIEVPDVPAPAVVQPRPSLPVTLGIPLTTQLTAQFIGQQAAVQQQAGAEVATTEETRPVAAKDKAPTLSTARGTSAYSIAAIRSDAVNAKPDPVPVEAL